MSRKNDLSTTWREYGQCYYDFIYENYIDWPVTSLQWGNVLQSS